MGGHIEDLRLMPLYDGRKTKGAFSMDFKNAVMSNRIVRYSFDIRLSNMQDAIKPQFH